MPKTGAKKNGVRAALKDKALFDLKPWTCRHHPDRSDIEAYIPGTGAWEVIAAVSSSKHVDAKKTSSYIVEAANTYAQQQKTIAALISALELCLECELSWEAEQEADIALRRAAKAE